MKAARRSSRAAIALVVAAVLITAVCVVAMTRWMVGPSGPRGSAGGSSEVTAQALPTTRVGPEGLIPTQIALPTIGVETLVEATTATTSYSPTLGRDITVFGLPSDHQHTAWWSDGPRVGADGMSVIVGRSSGVEAPGALDGIRSMNHGDKIVLRSKDRQVLTYLVNSVISDVGVVDAAELHSRLGAAPSGRTVALVAYGVDRDLPERVADVVVFGQLRSA